MRIVQVSTADLGGGAEGIARTLFEGYRARGHQSRLLVGRKLSTDPDVVELSGQPEHPLLGRLARTVAGPRAGRVAENPTQALAHLRGSEDVRAPASWRVLDPSLGGPADIVHGHNLHGADYFDLRALPSISRRVPLVLTLHDAWLLSGHCAHSLDCDRWRLGCGHCPDLTLYPAIRRDNTAQNFARKQDIFGRTRVYLSAPSHWLLERARQSHLAGSIVDSRVIPNGIDTRLFCPGDQRQSRASLGIPLDARVVLFVATGGTRNPWKDADTLRLALTRLGRESPEQHVVCLVAGESGPVETIGSVTVRRIGFEREPSAVARLYQATDVYVHPARADTFPLTVLEALACGTPVIATAVGGIPEQVRPLDPAVLRMRDVSDAAIGQATGVLVPARDAGALAHAMAGLLDAPGLRARIANNARRDAVARFSQDVMIEAWLSWYAEIHAPAPVRYAHMQDALVRSSSTASLRNADGPG